MPVSYRVTDVVTAMAVIACIIPHDECLAYPGRRLPLRQHRHRRRVVVPVPCILTLHIAASWIPGGGCYALLQAGDHGALTGDLNLLLLDCVHDSAVVFTGVGFGDILPTGPLRFMTGTEATAGLTFITWTASLPFLFMQKPGSFKSD